MADFLIFYPRHTFSIDYSTHRQQVLQNFFVFLKPTPLWLSRKIIENFLTRAQHSQKIDFFKIFFENFQKYRFLDMKG